MRTKVAKFREISRIGRNVFPKKVFPVSILSCGAVLSGWYYWSSDKKNTDRKNNGSDFYLISPLVSWTKCIVRFPRSVSHRGIFVQARLCARFIENIRLSRDKRRCASSRRERTIPGRRFYEGENETYIEASAENSGSILYDKEIRDKPRTRRTKRNV